MGALELQERGELAGALAHWDIGIEQTMDSRQPGHRGASC